MEKQMNYVIRPLTKAEEPFLWEMLYYAAHMEEDGETSLQAAKNNPDLIKYAKDWGRETDMGFIALEPHSHRAIGAAWVRLLLGEDKTFSYINDFIPELAIAVVPDYIGKGVGALLLTHLLEAAKKVYPAVVLSVRSTNPARHLYERLGFVIIEKAINRVGTESFNMIMQFQTSG
jgi:ribosomal protein S18 acetylase RimI-like enzyme